MIKIIADTNIPFVSECFNSVGQVQTLGGREITPEVIADADAMLVRSITPVNEKLLKDTNIQFVGTATIGLEHIDTDYLAAKNIGFASAPGSNANSVAEYVAAALLSVAGKTQIKLEGKSIGIAGVGNVGSRVEEKVRALGMETYLNDPPLERKTNDKKYLPLTELFNCDFISLHTPLTFDGIDKTFHLADEQFFDSLKRGCGFINTSRGGVVDTAALKAAIKEGKLGPVILDVWENEPTIDIELLRIVDLSTPHIAGYSFDGKVAGMIMIYNALCKQFGLEPKHSIEDFLPDPELPEIRLDTQNCNDQETILQVIQQVYVINRDDFNTREIAMVPESDRGQFFDDLRKNYPVRREFQNTTVIIKNRNSKINRTLEAIGFKIKEG